MRLQKISLATRDMARTQDFYQALGFRLTSGGNGPGTVLAPEEGSDVVLELVEDRPGTRLAMELGCGDLSAEADRLRRLGIAVSDGSTGGDAAGRGSGRITDPEGRIVDLRQAGPRRRLTLRSGSQHFRAGIAAVGALAIAVSLVSVLHALGVSESPTVVTVLLLPLLVYGVISGRLHEFTGPGGWGAKFAELTRQQELQASDIESIRVALRGLVSKYELQHLRGLATMRPFVVNYGKEFYGELKRLDDFGFLLPHPGLEGGLHTLFERFGHEEGSPLESRTRFDLHDYVVMTQEGRRYLDLHEASAS